MHCYAFLYLWNLIVTSSLKVLFDSFPEFSITKCTIFYYLWSGFINLFKIFWKALCKTFIYFVAKKISTSIIICPVFIKKTSPYHNEYSEVFIHKGRVLKFDMFVSFIGTWISSTFAETHLILFSRLIKIFMRKLLNIYSKWQIIKVTEIDAMLIYGRQTILSHRHLTNEDYCGLSKCGCYMFLGF